jgi:hypothetical protein
VLGASCRREAADPDIAIRSVDPQEVLEQRRFVPAEELREEAVVEGPPTTRQRGYPVGHASGVLANRRCSIPGSRGFES